MRVLLRTLAVLIAVAAIVDPVLTRIVSRPSAVEILVPPTSHPDHARAVTARRQAEEQLQEVARFDNADVPRAHLAIGGATERGGAALPLHAMSLPAPQVSVERFVVPERTLTSQQIAVRLQVRGRGIAGQTSRIQLRADGVTVANAEHRWRDANEVHQAGFAIPALQEGVHRLQVEVITGDASVTAGASVAVSGRPRRVLVYEPRPSWPAAFARRSLEDDPTFELATLARSAPRVATTSGDPSVPLAASRLNEFDAVVVGGLDAVADADARVLVEFVARRGGTLILLPDRRLPDGLRSRLGLPPLEELLLQEPVQVDGGELKARASEFLVPALNAPVTPIAGMQRGNTRRPVVFAVPLGNGTIVMSGAMDAWRYRGSKEQDLERLTRSLVAEAAAAAPPPIAISLSPAVERPGEVVTLLVTLRETELGQENGGTTVPRISAAVIDERGHREIVRLWPASRVGEFRGEMRVAREGRYIVEATTETRRADAILTIAADVTHPGSEFPLAAVAALTGGAVHATVDDVRQSLARIGSSEEVRRTHPMRSAWWLVPFVGLLTSEWILRRRAGLR